LLSCLAFFGLVGKMGVGLAGNNPCLIFKTIGDNYDKKI